MSNTIGLCFNAISNGKQWSVSRGAANAAAIVIPATHEGKPVTAIADNAFAGYTNLTKVTIPIGVTSIGEQAFSECTNLTSVTIPGSVKSIGNCAFSSAGLTGITIPNGLTSIGEGAFSGCHNLRTVAFASGIKLSAISRLMFNNCLSLRTFTIPGSVTSIGDDAFSYCPGLTSVTIPGSVMSIGNAAFSNSGLTSITIPNSVRSFGDSVFSNCQDLRTVTFASGIRLSAISHSMFYYCISLKEIAIPDSVTSINYGAFSDCHSLKTLKNESVGVNVTTIGGNAFVNTAIEKVLIRSKVTKICKGAFQDVPLNFVNFEPARISTIENEAFPGDLTAKYRNGGAGKYYNDGSNTWTKEGQASSSNSPADKFNYGESYDGSGTFICAMNKSISGALVIPSSVQGSPIRVIADFQNIKGITSVAIPDSIIRIIQNAFSGCTGLASIAIPASVNTIDQNAFAGCTNLKTVTFNGSSIDYVVTNSFPGDLVNKYKAGGYGTYTRPGGSSIWTKQGSAQTVPASAPKPAPVQKTGNYLFAGKKAEIVSMTDSSRLPQLVPKSGTAKDITRNTTTGLLSAGAVSLNSHKSLETNGSSVYLLVWDDAAWNNPEYNRVLFRIQPNSIINFENSNNDKTTIYGYVGKGSAKEEEIIATVSGIEELVFLLSSVNKQKLQTNVAEWRRTRPDNDVLADHVINTKSAKTGFLGVVTGLNSPVLMPAEFARVMTQWLVQSEIAYALACVYGYPPDEEEFFYDLLFLFAGETYVKEILKEIGEADALKTGEKVRKEWIQSRSYRRISKKVTAKLPEKAHKKITSKTAKVLVETQPVFKASADGVINTSSAKSFGQQAKIYYKPAIASASYLPPGQEEDPTLKQGSKGEAVKYLQELLNSLGEADLETDGVFGSLTKAAVKAFQKNRNLKIDGSVGPQTWSALK